MGLNRQHFVPLSYLILRALGHVFFSVLSCEMHPDLTLPFGDSPASTCIPYHRPYRRLVQPFLCLTVDYWVAVKNTSSLLEVFFGAPSRRRSLYFALTPDVQSPQHPLLFLPLALHCGSAYLPFLFVLISKFSSFAAVANLFYISVASDKDRKVIAMPSA